MAEPPLGAAGWIRDAASTRRARVERRRRATLDDTARSNGPPYPRTVGTLPLIRSSAGKLQRRTHFAPEDEARVCRASRSEGRVEGVIARFRSQVGHRGPARW